MITLIAIKKNGVINIGEKILTFFGFAYLYIVFFLTFPPDVM